MAVLGSYEKDGKVVIEFSDHAPVVIEWREAVSRAVAIGQAEARIGIRRREITQTQIEQVLAAAAKARKKADPMWNMPKYARMFKEGKPNSVSKPPASVIVTDS